jgi:hypothetical protein
MSRNLFLPTPEIIQPTSIVKVVNGGSGSSDGETGVINLGGIPLSHKNTSNGVGGLNKFKKLTASLFDPKDIRDVSVTGNTTVTQNSTNVYAINNYDEFKDYTAVAINGSVSVTNNLITYIAPSELGIGQFYINNRLVTVTVVASIVNKPRITSPAVGAENIPKSINITSSAFIVRGATDSHEGSDWQLSKNSAFTNIVTSTVDDTVNKTSWLVDNLLENTTYYIRVRHKAVNLDYSDWSDTYSFKTRKSFLPSLLEAELTANDKSAGDNFGVSTSITADGSRLVIGSHKDSLSTASEFGAIFVNRFTGTNWVTEARLIASDRLPNDLFGYSVAISKDGTRLVVGSPFANESNIVDSGAIYVFTRFGTTWSQEAILIASDIAANMTFGRAVTMDETGTRIAAVGYNSSGKNVAYMFVRSVNNWSQEGRIVLDNIYTAYDGECISINNNGDKIAVGSGPSTINSVANMCSIDILARAGSSWTKEAKVKPTNDQGLDNFGSSVCMSSDGTKVIVGANNRDVSGVVNCGSAFIFSKSGSVWSQDVQLFSSDRKTNDNFGNSVSCNIDCSVVSIGSYSSEVGNISNAGAGYVFSFNGTGWVQNSRLVSLNSTTDANFGWSTSLSQNTYKLAFSSINSDPSNIINAGSTHVFN